MSGRLAAALFLVLCLLLSTGCITFKGVAQPNQAAPGSTISVVMDFEISGSDTPDRPFLAVRFPNGWSVQSATYSGVERGTLIPEPKVSSSVSGGSSITPKPGYSWWSGVTERFMLNKTESTAKATLVLQVGATPGTYYLDYVVGTWSGSWPSAPALTSTGPSPWLARRRRPHPRVRQTGTCLMAISLPRPARRLAVATLCWTTARPASGVNSNEWVA